MPNCVTLCWVESLQTKKDGGPVSRNSLANNWFCNSENKEWRNSEQKTDSDLTRKSVHHLLLSQIIVLRSIRRWKKHQENHLKSVHTKSGERWRLFLFSTVVLDMKSLRWLFLLISKSVFHKLSVLFNFKQLILDLFSWFLFKIFLGQFKMASAPSASRSEFIVGGKYRLVRQSNFFALLRFRCKRQKKIFVQHFGYNQEFSTCSLNIIEQKFKIEFNMSPSTRKEVV